MRAKSLLRLPRGNVGARHGVPLQSVAASLGSVAAASPPPNAYGDVDDLSRPVWIAATAGARIVDRAGLLVKVINSQVRINQWMLIIRLIKGGAN